MMISVSVRNPATVLEKLNGTKTTKPNLEGQPQHAVQAYSPSEAFSLGSEQLCSD